MPQVEQVKLRFRITFLFVCPKIKLIVSDLYLLLHIFKQQNSSKNMFILLWMMQAKLLLIRKMLRTSICQDVCVGEGSSIIKVKKSAPSNSQKSDFSSDSGGDTPALGLHHKSFSLITFGYEKRFVSCAFIYSNILFMTIYNLNLNMAIYSKKKSRHTHLNL